MPEENLSRPSRVLIASANPLFARGLERAYQEHWGELVEIRLAERLEQALEWLDGWQPDLAILDYDDQSMRQETFLSRFISSQRPMRVMLASLQESGAVVVYDRRTLTYDQAQHWAFPAPDEPTSKDPGGTEV